MRGTVLRTMDLRYRRQGYELNVPYDPSAPANAIAAFHRLHEQRYGFCDVNKPVEIVNVRVRMVAAGETYLPAQREPVAGDGDRACYTTRDVYFDGRLVSTRVYRRESLAPGDVVSGPAMITEYTSATVLPPDSIANVDTFGNLVINIAEETA